MVKFNLNSVPSGSTVSSAKLHLYVRNVTRTFDQAIYLHSVNTAWSAWGLTWNSFGGDAGTYDPSVLASTNYSSLASGQWVVFNIPTNTAQAWLADPSSNNGLLLRPSYLQSPGFAVQNTTATFASSREANTSLRPKLEITYSPPPYVDRDTDGVADSWESAFFGGTNVTLGGPGEDYDHDGALNLNEYLAGTNPTNGNDSLTLTLRMVGTNVVVSFYAVGMNAQYYAETQRLYSVETRTNLLTGDWTDLGAFTNMAGNNSTRSCTNPPSAAAAFYRVKANLN